MRVKFWSEKLKRKDLLGDLVRGWEDNTKKNLKYLV